MRTLPAHPWRYLPLAAIALLAGCRHAPPTSSTAPAVASPQAAGTGSHWQCGEQRIDVMPGPASTDLRIEHAGGQLRLTAGDAGDAAYADGHGNAFASHGERARLTLAGQATLDCVASAEPSPWQQAQARGAAFRALGTEPFWSLEIGPGAQPMLHAQLDAGQRQVSARLQRTSDGRYSGRTGNTAISIGIERGPCSDGMSDVTYQASVRLRLGDEDYRGCGRYLTP